MILTITGEDALKTKDMVYFLKKFSGIPLLPVYTDDTGYEMPGVIHTPRCVLNKIDEEEVFIKWRSVNNVYVCLKEDLGDFNLVIITSSKLIKAFYWDNGYKYDFVKIRLKGAMRSKYFNRKK